jgi:hypothetical protein
LLTGDDAAQVLVNLADLLGAVPTPVGKLLTETASQPTENSVRAKLRGHPVLTELEILFDPVLNLDPVRLLARLASEAPPLIAHWPVATSAESLRYPPGVGAGRDTASELQGCLLLTTRPTIFADDAPFTIERFC